MNKLVLLFLGLALCVGLSTSCTPGVDCVTSNDACDPLIPPGQVTQLCCRQVAQVLALTAASARASALAYATAHACAHACTGAEAYAYATACATAHVCITQSVCLSINTGKCCEVSSTIAANASSYASAAAFASASARAAARAAASASAGASAASHSAASLHARASALITSSCCGFNLRIHALVEAVGNFSVQAAVAVDAAVAVSAQANLTADSCVAASDSVSATTSAMLSAGINNCCVANRTAQYATDSSANCNRIVNETSSLFQLTNEAYDAIYVGAQDYNEIIDPVELRTFVCASECKDALITCCTDSDCCGTENIDTVCLAAEVYVYVAMEAKAFADAIAGVQAYTVAAVQVRTEAKAAVYVAAAALVNVALLTDVNVKSCCSIVVTVSQTAVGIAGSIGNAFAKAEAAADAYAAAFSEASALSTAIASANATSFAFARLSYVGCCGQACCQSQECCEIAHECEYSEAGQIASDCAEAYDACYDDSVKNSQCWDLMEKTETALVISVASTQTAYLLQCCCCTKPPTTTTTKRVTFKSSSLTFAGPTPAPTLPPTPPPTLPPTPPPTLPPTPPPTTTKDPQSGGGENCLGTTYWNGVECVRKPSINEACSPTIPCAGNLVCESNFCVCAAGSHYNSTIKSCVINGGIGGFCVGDTECPTNAECVNSKCQCKPNCRLINNECIPIPAPVTNPCVIGSCLPTETCTQTSSLDEFDRIVYSHTCEPTYFYIGYKNIVLTAAAGSAIAVAFDGGNATFAAYTSSNYGPQLNSIAGGLSGAVSVEFYIQSIDAVTYRFDTDIQVKLDYSEWNNRDALLLQLKSDYVAHLTGFLTIDFSSSTSFISLTDSLP